MGFHLYLPTKSEAIMISFRAITPFVAGLLLFAGCHQRDRVDLIIRNAKIYTVNNSFAVVQGAAVRNGRFVAVGSDANINARYTADSVIDLHGKYVFPGFIDTHSHFIDYALSLGQADLGSATGANQALKMLENRRNTTPDNWIVARNLNSEFADSVAAQIDNAFPDSPVFIWLCGQEQAVVNRALISKVGISTGNNRLLTIDETVATAHKLPQVSADSLTQLMQQAERNFFAVGITSATDYGTSYDNTQIINQMYNNKQLQIPIYIVLEPSAENIENYISKIPVYSDNQKILAVAVSIDGSLASGKTAMIEPFKNRQRNAPLVTTDSLARLCQMAIDHGFQMCVSCSGDSATRLAINTYASILPNKNNLRWRLDNLQAIQRSDLKRIGHYNIIPAVVPVQYAQSNAIATQLLNKSQQKVLFAWKRILEQNQGIVAGIDVPNNQLSPMAVYHAATHQERLKLRNKQGQEMSSIQALKAMTLWAAYSQFDDDSKGSIEVGKWADFIIINENITTMYRPNIPNVKVRSTYLHGKKVYDSKN